MPFFWWSILKWKFQISRTFLGEQFEVFSDFVILFYLFRTFNSLLSLYHQARQGFLHLPKPTSSRRDAPTETAYLPLVYFQALSFWYHTFFALNYQVSEWFLVFSSLKMELPNSGINFICVLLSWGLSSAFFFFFSFPCRVSCLFSS